MGRILDSNEKIHCSAFCYFGCKFSDHRHSIPKILLDKYLYHPTFDHPTQTIDGWNIGLQLRDICWLMNCLPLPWRIMFGILMVFILLFIFYVTLSSRHNKQSCQSTQKVKFHIKYLSRIYTSKFIDERILYVDWNAKSECSYEL